MQTHTNTNTNTNTYILSHVGKYLLLDLALSKLLLEGCLGRCVEHLLPGVRLVRTPREEKPAKATTRGVPLVEPDGDGADDLDDHDDHDGHL